MIVVPKTSASTDHPWFGLAKYAWSGYGNVPAVIRLVSKPFQSASPSNLLLSFVLECVNCGVIYRSRQYWVGNQDPESGVVRSEVKHVWLGVGTHTSSLLVYRSPPDILSFFPTCPSESCSAASFTRQERISSLLFLCFLSQKPFWPHTRMLPRGFWTG